MPSLMIYGRSSGVALLGSLAIGYGYYQKDRLKDEEILELFVTGEVKDDSFLVPMGKAMEGSRILNVHYACYSSKDSTYGALASANLSSTSDLFFLPESVASQKQEYAAYARVLPEEEQKKYTSIAPSLSFFDQAGRVKGIKLYDPDDESYSSYNEKVSSYFSFDEATYLFLSSTSNNAEDKDSTGEYLTEKAAEAFLSYLFA